MLMQVIGVCDLLKHVGGWGGCLIKIITENTFSYIYIYIDTLYRHNWLLHNGLTSVGNAKRMRQREYRQKK